MVLEKKLTVNPSGESLLRGSAADFECRLGAMRLVTSRSKQTPRNMLSFTRSLLLRVEFFLDSKRVMSLVVNCLSLAPS